MSKPEECRYMPSHEWVHIDGGIATVGISDHAQKEVTDVVFVDLPKPGKKVTQKGNACVLESVKAAFDIYAPVGGEIIEANQALVNDPALVNREPHDGGWLFKIKAANPDEAKSLMDWNAYQEFLKSGAAHGSH